MCLHSARPVQRGSFVLILCSDVLLIEFAHLFCVSYRPAYYTCDILSSRLKKERIENEGG